jgi:hypothetical protein
MINEKNYSDFVKNFEIKRIKFFLIQVKNKSLIIFTFELQGHYLKINLKNKLININRK